MSGEDTGTVAVEVKNGATLNIYNKVKVKAGSSIYVDATSTLAFEEGQTFTNEGTLTIDYGAYVDFSKVENNGTITLTIPAGTKFEAGLTKLLDFDSFSGEKVVINGLSDEYSTIIAEDGDILVGNVDTSVLFVNSSYNSSTMGDGKYFGVNAFGSLDGVVAKFDTVEEANSSTTEIKINGDVALSKGKQFIYTAADLAITGTGKITQKRKTGKSFDILLWYSAIERMSARYTYSPIAKIAIVAKSHQCMLEYSSC
jgi:hypothetical protein